MDVSRGVGRWDKGGERMEAGGRMMCLLVMRGALALYSTL